MQIRSAPKYFANAITIILILIHTASLSILHSNLSLAWAFHKYPLPRCHPRIITKSSNTFPCHALLLQKKKNGKLPSYDISSTTFHCQDDSNVIPVSVNGNEPYGTKKDTSVLVPILLLNFVAIIWGTQHTVTKLVVDDCDAASFNLIRFIFAALLTVPYTPSLKPWIDHITARENSTWNHTTSVTLDESVSQLEDSNFRAEIIMNQDRYDTQESIQTWTWGFEMGFWMFLGYAFQSIGLAFTTAQRSGFLLYLNVKLVPFFARIIFGRDISIPTWISAGTAFAGTALLSYDGSSVSLNVGDLWSILAAAASAMFILRLESASAAITNKAALNSTTLWVVAFASFLWCVANTMIIVDIVSSSSTSSITSLLPIVSPSDIPLFHLNSLFHPISIAVPVITRLTESIIQTIQQHPIELVYLGGVSTALSNYIQTKAQAGISAERASIIYAMDPVYGALFANFMLGEQLNVYGMIGATLITVAAAFNAYLDFGLNKKSE